MKFFGSKRRVITTIAILIVAAVVAKIYFSKEAGPVYKTTAVMRGDLEKNVLATGKLDAVSKVDVGSQVSGQLQSLYVKEGDSVKKDQLLAVIDPKKAENIVIEAEQTVNELKANLAQAQAEYQFALATYQRRLQLAKVQVISKQELDESRKDVDVKKAAIDTYNAQIKRNQATLDTAKNDLQYTNIRAPMDGIVTQIKTLQGQTVIAAQEAPTILSLADLNSMLVKAEVSEADVVYLKPGLPASFTVLGAPDKEFKGQLKDILPKPEKINDAIFYYARFEVPNPQHLLKLDMTAQVKIDLDTRKNVLIVPLAALGREITPTEYEVEVLKDDQPEIRQVTIGSRNDINVEIVKGLAENDLVITGIEEAEGN